MDSYDGLVKKELLKYGHIEVKLSKVMDEQHITRNRLTTLVDGRYQVITRYYKGENVQMVDLDLFARICCVLHCDLSDLLEYVPEPEEEEDTHK